MKKYLFKQVHNPSDKEMKALLDEVSRDDWELDKVTSSPDNYGRTLFMFFVKEE